MAKHIQPVWKRVKVNLPGGFVSIGDLRTLLEAIESVGIHAVKIGNRQQLLFAATAEQLDELTYDLLNQELLHEVVNDYYPNIVSSYVSDGIFNQSRWLREGIYKDILASFEFVPKLKVNIVDANQSLVPYYTGNLNFVSSDIGNFWHVFVRWPKANQLFEWSSLVYSMDIAEVCRQLEKLILQGDGLPKTGVRVRGASLETKVKEAVSFHSQEPGRPLVESEFRLPYYEGFNRYEDKFWLGIYRPDETYTVSFLLDVCDACQTSRIGQLYTTPWRSLIIKDIRQEDRMVWDYILDKHRVNLRHASNELNWQLEDWCEPALKLKRSIVRYFDRLNIRTYRLCFGIKIGTNSGIWGSIILKDTTGGSKEPCFDVLHTEDFNANARILIPYKQGVPQQSLPHVLKQLCDNYYDSTIEGGLSSTRPAAHLSEAPEGVPTHPRFQCTHCLSIYDAAYGDALAAVPPGLAFTDLPTDYTCGLCGAPKKDFKLWNYISH
ncbi:rubredoxin domain-containing protein [Parapedobacter soli]|uniref:rubredoxin domain-containing protein n=1 Tax=Parapedobacter soli TaxID=416955 RepID=UPI0021C67261|nr:rubredoxin domain-containing protein [Parapedobacter soli]